MIAPLNLELAQSPAKVNAAWGNCSGPLSWQICSELERFLWTPASLMAVWRHSWIRHVWLGNMQHIWTPPVFEHSVLWSALSDAAYTHLEACNCHRIWRSECNPLRKSYKGVLLSGVPLSISVGSLCFPLIRPSRQRWRNLAAGRLFLGAKARDFFRKEISGCCIYVMWCDVCYWGKLNIILATLC